MTPDECIQAEPVLRLAHKFAVTTALEGYERFLLQDELTVAQHRWVCYPARMMQSCMLLTSMRASSLC